MKKILLVFISVLLFSFAFFSTATFAEKNGDLLKTFNNQTGFYYTVKKGDTLWDLSHKFYNSEWDWPGLWELNDEITNPHLIYPGQKLRIFFKSGLSLENKPIRVAPEKKEEPVEVTTEKVPEIKEPPKPEIQLTFSYPFIDQVGFIKEKAVTPAGKILRSKKDYNLISENDSVYIEANKELTPGRQYLVYETAKIRNTGIRHTIKGIIKITDQKSGYYTGTVVETFIDLNPNDLIMNFIERDNEFVVKEDNNGINASLICNDSDDKLFGERDIVYMDKGTKDAIEIGQIYTIYKNLEDENTSFSKNDVKLDPIVTGKLIVLHTEHISSTVYIFSAKEEIYPGYPVH